jgi:hypothetical protein
MKAREKGWNSAGKALEKRGLRGRSSSAIPALFQRLWFPQRYSSAIEVTAAPL